MTTTVESIGLSDAAAFFKALAEVSNKSASIAINQVMGRNGMALIRQRIEDQIAFPKGYLSGDRLGIAKYAKPNDLEGIVRARKRATSLARFASGQPLGKVGITVRVGNGGATALRAAWLVRLKRGASLSEDNYNVGLAVRIKPGDTISNKMSDHKSWLVPGKVALLYGPSVDQVFRGVADEVALPIADLVAAEFFRQLDLRA
jgi:hypothetical protein